MKRHAIWLQLIGMVWTLSCGGGSDGGKKATVDEGVCLSGQQWTGGRSGTSRMLPGHDCSECHGSFFVSGTVYGALDEPDDCYGVENAQVLLTGADGELVTLTTNQAGNFYFRNRDDLIQAPFTVAVYFLGQTVEMPQALDQTQGNCNHCHTALGDFGAPGRVAVEG